MASYGQAAPRPASHHHAAAAAAYAAHPMAAAAPAAVPHAAMPGHGGPVPPPGTFAPGTKIQVGNHRVVVQKYLSEGGFAHVYLVKLPAPINGTDLAVLKRVAVPDKESLRGMRTEVETMKRLKGHRAIVTYIDSHASELRGGGYEVFLLMEYCNGGGLIDFMNTRLQHRLTEPEILTIFADVAEGVACMHYLRPPLLHRDLKVENVLITLVGNTRRFKLCDFGSAAPPRPAPTTAAECRAIDEDVQKHTTMQYRSPEMVDVYRKLPIDEKSDIWALGVLLYKLCYYTTPFEEQGTLAILNASYKFPSYPVFSDRLRGLIAWMLQENPQARPNIYQVLREACAMQGREPPIKDIYSGRTQVDVAPQTQKPLPDPRSPPVVGAVFSPQPTPQQVIPEVERMRRGRVPAPQPASRPTASPPKVTNGDPFAALDGKTLPLPGADELSSRFPTLDEFTLLHDRGQKFNFDSSNFPSPSLPQQPLPPQPQPHLQQRVVERLADEAFQIKPVVLPPALAPAPVSNRQSVEMKRTSMYKPPPLDTSLVSSPPRQPEISRASAIIQSTPELQAISNQAQAAMAQAEAPKPKPIMVSTGTMTSPTLEQAPPFPSTTTRVPSTERHRAASLPKSPTGHNSSLLGVDSPMSRTASRAPSYSSLARQPSHDRHPSSSRPSLEGGRPNLENVDVGRPMSRLAAKPRPVSTHLESNLDFLREQEARSRSPALPSPRHSLERRSLERSSPPSPAEQETTIESNVEFLRKLEEPDKKKDRTSKHLKRSSLSSLAGGTKAILSGKFSEAFKRFESSSSSQPARAPSPLKELERRELTPIPGSEPSIDDGSDGRRSPDWEDMTPEQRREHEARLLAQEEARVAAAQAEYRARVAQRTDGTSNPTPLPKSIGGVSRAVSIQNKVQSLLEESTRSSTTVPRTAQGYGHYSDAAHAASAATAQSTSGSPTRPQTSAASDGRPTVPRKPVSASIAAAQITGSSSTVPRPPTSSSIEPSSTGRSTVRPVAPPKPTHLITSATGGAGGAGAGIRPPSPGKHLSLPAMPGKLRSTGSNQGLGISTGTSGSTTEALLAVDLPGMKGPALLEMTEAEKDDYIRDFQKRFPNLEAIEMVETDVSAWDGRSSAGKGRAR